MGARNPEALKPYGGHIWTSGKKGDIYKDEFFYVPDKFDWLGTKFKGVKSLVSGIGLKITDIVGEKFNSIMDGISFKERRNGVAERNTKLGSDVFTRRVMFKRVAYYKPSSGQNAWELGKGTCAIKEAVGEHDIFLFVGVAEVDIDGSVSGGYSWSFQKDKFFNGDWNCGILMKKNPSKYRLVIDKIGRFGTNDRNKGEKVILLGAETRGIMNFGNSKNGKPLIGFLMGVAVNLAQSNDCNSAFSGGVEGRKRFNEVKSCLERVEKKVTNEGGGGLKISGSNRRDTSINEDWVKGKLKEGLKGWGKISKLSTWTNGTELPYRYQ